MVHMYLSGSLVSLFLFLVCILYTMPFETTICKTHRYFPAALVEFKAQHIMRGSRGGTGGPDPLGNHKNIGFP